MEDATKEYMGIVRREQDALEGRMIGLCGRVREDVIKPLCRRYGLHFHSGMGVWFFSLAGGADLFDGCWPWPDDDSADDLDTNPDCPADWPRDYDAVADLLCSVVGGLTVGDYVESFLGSD